MAYEFLAELESIIAERQADPKDTSYTTSLFASGIKHIGRKVGEEAVELIMEIHSEEEEPFIDEAADLLYHLMVLLRSKGYSLEDISERLRERNQSSKS